MSIVKREVLGKDGNFYEVPNDPKYMEGLSDYDVIKLYFEDKTNIVYTKIGDEYKPGTYLKPKSKVEEVKARILERGKREMVIDPAQTNLGPVFNILIEEILRD